MQYFGGKSRNAKWLASVILPLVQGRALQEPFCGALSATVALKPNTASDLSPSLINMILSIRNGWVPPESVSEETYASVKAAKDPTDPMTAFCGFGCSFSGKWFGGYARGTPGHSYALGGSFAQTASRTIRKRVLDCAEVDFQQRSYLDIQPSSGDVVYCDPPYNNTSHGYEPKEWCQDTFWSWCRAASAKGALIIVSEFSGPDDARVIGTKDAFSAVDGHNTGARRTVEKLFAMGH